MGFARPAEDCRTFHFGRQVGSKFAFFRNLFEFFSHDASKLRFLSFPDGFGMDFGRFGGGSGVVLEVVFQKILFSLEKIDKFKGSEL